MDAKLRIAIRGPGFRQSLAEWTCSILKLALMG